MPVHLAHPRPMCTLLLAVGLAATPALAQSTAFAYQGRLTNAGQPATGSYDIRFRVYNALSGGVQTGPTFCAENIAVSGGLFTATVDVGQQYATGEPRYLEIEVRPDTGLNCATSTGYTLLAPRQLLTDTPRAMVAQVAHALAIPNGSTLNAVNVDNSGNVGIGTAAPATKLHIDGGANTSTDVIINSGLTQSYFSSLNFFDRGVNTWAVGKADANYFFIGEAGVGPRVAVAPGGNVGIGTVTPTSLLELAGAQNALKIQGPQPYVTMVDSTGGNIRVLLQNENGRYFVVSESFLNGTNTGGFTMVDAQGRLGLGTFNPGATLDVAGTIKIAPTIRWKSVHGSAFQPEYFNDASFGTIGGLHTIDSFGTSNSGTVGYQGGGTAAAYFAPLELPDGATLEDLIVDGRDTSASQDIVLSIGKVALGTGFVTEVAQTFTSGSSGSIQHPNHGPISEPPIDNANNVYFLRAKMATSGSSAHWLLAARVKYSVTAPLP